MKKFVAAVMSLTTMCSMAGFSANAEEMVECESNYYVKTIESTSEYDLVMGSATFNFVDHSWQDDSITYYQDISTKDGLAIGTVYCYYKDNTVTDKVQGSYYSSYYHYCNTSTENNSSGLSETADPYVRIYNSSISYAPGADAVVKGFALT